MNEIVVSSSYVVHLVNKYFNKMLIYDVLHKEKVYQSVANDLRTLGVKHRVKKNAVKTEKTERNRNSLRKVFKVPLAYQPLDVVNLSSGAIVHVPVFVCQAAAYLDKFMNQEGLFRKAGSHVRQKELIARLDNGGTLGDKNHAIDVANCLKTFFRDLPEPLIPFVYHDLFVRCLMLRSRRVDALLLACILLPPHHLNTLAFFMDFLKRVSLYEAQNKMSVDNLAKVIGPNIMPLQETTMSAVQSRLEAHLVIVKILIENAENIGVLPEHISESISAEVIGSVETELDHSDASSRQRSKKKKHRSGSLTRMFNGLKKMVGKSGSPGEGGQCNNQLVPTDMDPLHTPSIKVGKKRKVAEPAGPISVKKKRDILDAMPERTSHHVRPLFASPVSSNPNPVRERSPPVHKSKVRKYLTHKVHSEIRVLEKVDKSKKLRMSLDRFVSRSKQKVADVDMGVKQLCKEPYSPCIERRWSSASSSSATKKKRETQVDNQASVASPMIRKATTLVNVRDDYDRIFMEADVNLSDDCGDPSSQDPGKWSENENRPTKRSRPSTCRRSLDTTLLPNATSDYAASYTPKHDKNLRSSSRRMSSSSEFQKSVENSRIALERDSDLATALHTDACEEYVRIPKSEYEKIKSRVSAIESRISQEFGCIASESETNSISNSVSNVQSEYEKTLGEASIESTITADHLAKRLSKELKIRRSSEHKIIRSPSARKIGILRRRSQEKPPSRRVSRTASWHISQRTDVEKNSKPNAQLNNAYASPKRGRGRPPDYYSEIRHESLCSEDTNARLNYLQEQLHTLITHTAEHTRGSFSDEDGCAGDDDDDDDVFTPQISTNKLAPQVRRASSFHGNEFIDNSQYFNNRVKELKKTNSQQHIGASIESNNESATPDARRQRTISWKDAAGYFKLDGRSNYNNTPVPQTGRASIAKLRTQNAGMVLAKAKLFDENTCTKNSNDVVGTEKKSHGPQERAETQTTKMSRVRELKNLELDATSPRKAALSRRKNCCKSPKNNNAKLRLASSPNYSPLIKMELTIVPPQGTRQVNEKRLNSRRASHKFDQENRELARSNAKANQIKIIDDVFEERGANSGAYLKENKLSRSPPISPAFAVNTNVQEANINIYNPDINSACKTPHIKRPLAVKTPKSARSLARRPAVDTRRTPLKAVPSLTTPKRQSPRIILKSRQLSKTAI